MTMYLIKNKNNGQYIKKQDTTTLNVNKIKYTNDIMSAQIYENETEADNNLLLLKQLTDSKFEAYKPFNAYKDEAEYFESNKDIATYLKWYQHDVNRYAHPSVTVDLIALRFNKETKKLQILLVKRKHWPYKGMWAMPGGFVNENETINHAVIRETKEETNVDLTNEMIIRRPAVSKKDRDPRAWVITNPNIVLFRQNSKTKSVAGDDAAETEWVNISFDHDRLQIDKQLAFDHYDIIERALRYLKSDFKSGNLPRITSLLGYTSGANIITLNMLKTLYGQLDAKYLTMNNSNLYRLYKKHLAQTAYYTSTTVGRPERIYEFEN